MGWLKLDDQRLGHEKLVAAGAYAELLDVRGMLYAAQRETDGFIPYHQLSVIAFNIPAPKKKAAKLCEVGRWHDDPDRGGWWVHDYLDYNPSAEDREAEREAARGRMRAARRKKKPRSSPERSEDVRPNFSGSSGNPVPVPELPNGSSSAARTRATQIPDSWQPSDAHQRIAAEEGVDCTREALKFRDHAKAGGRTLKDWDAGFRTWLRRASDYGARATPADSTAAMERDRHNPDAWTRKSA